MSNSSRLINHKSEWTLARLIPPCEAQTRGLTFGVDGGVHLGAFLRLVEHVERRLVVRNYFRWDLVVLLEHKRTPRSWRIVLQHKTFVGRHVTRLVFDTIFLSTKGSFTPVIYYRLQTKFAKVMFSKVSCQSTGGSTPRAVTSRADTPPPRRYYGIRSTSGRYASHWNAFLLVVNYCVIYSQFAQTCQRLKVCLHVTFFSQGDRN